MSVNPKELVKSEFWQKKILKVDQIRDINKDGFLSRADFMIFVEHYKDLGLLEEHLKKLHKNVDLLCMTLGLVDDSVELTHEEIVENFEKSEASVDDLANLFLTWFEIIDTDGNGKISYQEWVEYYKACRIDTVHARASFDAMDTNHDGTVSKEEFHAYNKEFYYSTEDTLHSSIMCGPLD